MASVPSESFWKWYVAALVPVFALGWAAINDRTHAVSNFAISQGAPEDVLGFGWPQQIAVVALLAIVCLLLLLRALRSARTSTRISLCIAQLIALVIAVAAILSAYNDLERRVFKTSDGSAGRPNISLNADAHLSPLRGAALAGQL